MKFLLTFGSQYSHEPHPLPNAHPSGWYAVHADSLESARHLAYSVMGAKWSNLYTEEEAADELNWDTYFPRGELGEIRALVVASLADRTEATTVTVDQLIAELVAIKERNTEPSLPSYDPGTLEVRVQSQEGTYESVINAVDQANDVWLIVEEPDYTPVDR